MSRVRILHIFGGLDAGGAESRTMDIYRSIDRQKVQFDFVTHTSKKGYFEDEINELGGRIYRLPERTFRNSFKYYIEVNNFFKNHREYNIIHGHSLSSGFVYLGIAKKHGVPVRIAHSRCGMSNFGGIKTIIKELFKKLSRFYATDKFAVSKLAGAAAFGKKSILINDVKIIPNAIDAKKYAYDAKTREVVRKEYNVENDFIIGHVGRFEKQKNHNFIIDVFKVIHEQYPNSTLILVGDGKFKNEIQEKVKKLGLEDNVIFTGVRSDVPNILQAMDVLLFPSFFEGLPGVVLEAQAAGLPCIISDRITDEVKITDLVEYVSLDKSEEYWAEKVFKFSQGFERRNAYNEIVRAGYDIESVAKWYQDFYLTSISL